MSTEPVLYVDIETRSRTDLRKSGAYRYVEDPDFQILMAAWSLDGDPVRVETDPERILGIPGLTDPDVIKSAHNAAFERVAFSRALGLPSGEYLDPAQWHDTMAIAGEYGRPQSLGALARSLGAEDKDEAGTRLINYFCKPNRRGEWNTPEDSPDLWAEFIEYCRQDVVTLIDVHQRLGGFPTRAEALVYQADQWVNDFGVAIDTELAAAAVEASDDNRMLQELRVSALTGVYNPGSRDQMLQWLRGRPGLSNVADLRAETVTRLLTRDDLDDTTREVLQLRQDLALVASKKYSAALDSVCEDGRLRGTLRFFGAHTGRWSGRGLQPQNLPRAAFETETETGAAILDLLLGHGADAETLKKLVRALFVGPFTIVDYASIEARVIAWLAGEEWALEAFRQGRDIYVETAARMSTPDRPLGRSQGKVAVLALGYQGAVNSLRAMGAEGDDAELAALVSQWRAANAKIVRFWYRLSDVIGDGGQVGQHIRVERDGEEMRIRLPSGRAIHYHGVRWERYRVIDPATGRPVMKEGWRYDDPKRPGQRIGTYGGRLAENITQAVARDLLALALVRLQRAGYDIAAHVHDEAVVQGIHDVEEIVRIMTRLPKWAAGLPVDAEGFTSERYRKG